VDLSFKNESDERIFINLKSAYQVTGFLEDKSGHVFEVEWSPQGASRSPVREDYAELAPGGTLALTLTSKKIRSEGGDGAIPWRTHRPGDYKLYVQFASGSKTYLMPNQWEGMTTSSDVTIRVR
jgi:hypothetical protein